MNSLLRQLKKGAYNIVSRIVDITNTGLSVDNVSLPHPDLHSGTAIGDCRERNLRWNDVSEAQATRLLHVIPESPSVITPELQSFPATGSPSDFDISENVDSDLSKLSPDKCGQIVDCLFGEMDVTVLSPPRKRPRLTPSNDPNIPTSFHTQPAIA